MTDWVGKTYWIVGASEGLGAALAHKLSRAGAEVIEIQCTLDPRIADARIERRLLVDEDPSDARPEIMDALRAQQDPWPESTLVNTDQPLAETIRRALDLVDPMN